MVYAITEIIILVLLTIPGLFCSKAPVFLIMSEAVLMILTAYQSVNEEKDKRTLLSDLVIRSVFAVLSGNFSGFLVFFFLKDVKVHIRVFSGTLMFVFVQFVVYRNTSVAMCMLDTIFLLLSFLAIGFLYSMLKLAEKRKVKENNRITAANISELHEKRLNEKLVMQKSLDERNARLLERENISRNIHNSVGHSITAAIMTLDAADLLYDVKPDEARRKMNDANNRIRGSLESVRRAVRVLDDDNAELTAGELKSELDMIIKEFVMDTDIQVYQSYSEIRDELKLESDHAVFFTGVLKELLTNGLKHGGASEFTVILSGDHAHVKLSVSDNGQSDFNDTNSKQKIENGFGIKKIISYAEKCGGKTQFKNDNGFKAMVELPVGFGG